MSLPSLRRAGHKIWQLLPPETRRAALFRVTAALAPRPDRRLPSAEVLATARVIIVGPLSSATGLGSWTRLALQAFTAAGRDARGIDLAGPMMQGVDFKEVFWRDGRDAMGPGTVLLHINAPYVPLALTLLGRKFLRHKKIIACWAWELPEIPPDWRWGLHSVHEIWGLSRFTADAIARRTTLPVKATPLPVVLGPVTPPGERLWRKPAGSFAVLTMFNLASGFTRKNPLGAIAAFRAAFGDDSACRLLVKIVNPDAYSEGMAQIRTAAAGAVNIEIIDRLFAPADNAALIAECDAVLSLHRAEGFGLVPAEAMLRGKPVVATGWSGNMDFMTPENSCPVAYRLVPATDPQRTYDHAAQEWAEPDIADAAAHLRHLRDDPAFAAALGARAAADGAAAWSMARYAAYCA